MTSAPVRDAQLARHGLVALRALGEGSYGAVLLARRCSQGALLPHAVAGTAGGEADEDVAVKMAHGSKQVAALDTERRMLEAISHACVPRAMGFWSDVDCESAGLVLEHVAGRDLHGLVKARGALPEVDALACVADVFAALTYLAEQLDPVVHRDVKPRNVLTFKGASQLEGSRYRAKLADFGLACRLSEKDVLCARVGSVGYASPEVCNSEPVEPRSDVFAAGCVLHYALTGCHIFGSDAHTWKRNCRCRLQMSPDLPGIAITVLTRLCAREVSARPSAREAVISLVGLPPDGARGWLARPALVARESSTASSPEAGVMPGTTAFSRSRASFHSAGDASAATVASRSASREERDGGRRVLAKATVKTAKPGLAPRSKVAASISALARCVAGSTVRPVG